MKYSFFMLALMSAFSLSYAENDKPENEIRIYFEYDGIWTKYLPDKESSCFNREAPAQKVIDLFVHEKSIPGAVLERVQVDGLHANSRTTQWHPTKKFQQENATIAEAFKLAPDEKVIGILGIFITPPKSKKIGMLTKRARK